MKAIFSLWGLLVSILAIISCAAPSKPAAQSAAPPADADPTIITEESLIRDESSVIDGSVVEHTSPTLPPTAAAPDVEPISGMQTNGNADVTFVRAVQAADGRWTFHVTVAHPDTGWEDYADGWDILLPDGTVVLPSKEAPFTRLLLHPHENEQPFTRSQSGLIIPETVTAVTVRAHDLVDGWGGQEILVDLTVNAGENFVVER